MYKFLNLKPSSSDVEKTKSWLFDEYQENDEGFYSNWNIIDDSIQDEEFFTFNLNNEPVGFITWKDSNFHRDVVIMSIKPEIRENGFGKQFFEEFKNCTLKNNFFAIKLHCSPKDSQYFWKKIGFNLIPDPKGKYPDLILYTLLVDSQEIDDNSPKNSLQLWDKEVHLAKRHSPNWIWNINETSNSNPIIKACDDDWKVKWCKDGQVKFEGKVKNFDEFLVSKVYSSPFFNYK